MSAVPGVCPLGLSNLYLLDLTGRGARRTREDVRRQTVARQRFGIDSRTRLARDPSSHE